MAVLRQPATDLPQTAKPANPVWGPMTTTADSKTDGAFEPLNEVRKNFRVDWYRCPTKPGELSKLMQRSDAAGLFQAVGHLALFAVTGLLTYFFFTRQIWLGFVLALFAHGTVGFIFQGARRPRVGPRHGLQDQGPAQGILADLQSTRLVELSRIRHESHLPPPLYLASSWRSRGDGAPRTQSTPGLFDPALHHQHIRRAGVQRHHSGPTRHLVWRHRPRP